MIARILSTLAAACLPAAASWADAAPTDAGMPVLSLAGTMPTSGDYGEVLAAIDGIGATATSLSLFWDDLERGGAYAPDPDWPAIAQAVYPPRDLALQLTFSVIDTVADRRPADLRGLPWDDLRVIERFDALAGEVLSRMPGVDLVSVAVGNEVDGVLADRDVDEYARFLTAARDAIHARRPDVPVTVKVTWDGLRSRPEILDLARIGDGLSITWYPMDGGFGFLAPDAALRELDAMAALADGPWELSEVGYPSGGCGASSEAAQARFLVGLRERAASLAALRLVQIVWSHDIPAAGVSADAGYYRVGDPCFASFLATLGLLTAKGAPKPAYEALAGR